MVAAQRSATGVLARLDAYAEGVVSGEVVAGRLVKLAAERHLRDVSLGSLRGIRFDDEAADHAIRFLEQLPHSKGELAGQKLHLEPWQVFMVGSVFGWLRADGTRRFRRAHSEVARKNGKTTLMAGVGLYLAFADGEPGAEVYSAATKRDQAKLCWDEARRMVEATPALARLVVVTPSKSNLSMQRTNSKFEPLGRDADTSDGLNPHAALIDELHAHTSRDLVDVLDTALGARRQPIRWNITTAGSNQESIWWEEREYAVRVLEGVIDDDTLFAYVATLDNQTHSRQLSGSAALRQMVSLCTCECRNVIQINETTRGGCAVPATRSGGTNKAHERNAIPTGGTGHADSVRVVTTGTSETPTPNTSNGRKNPSPDGLPLTENVSRPTSANGNTRTQSGSARSLDAHAIAFTASQKSNTPNGTSNKADAALSVEAIRNTSTWITATTAGESEDYSVDSATLGLVSSETLRKAYSEHSPTCAVRQQASLKGDTLTVTFPPDDWRDESVWVKANPNLSVSVKLDALREECAKAQQIPALQNAFRRLRLNQPTEQSERWIDMAQWDACSDVPQVEQGAHCYVGIDLSSKVDLTAAVAVFPADDGYLDVLCRFWRPEEGVLEAEKRDGVPYRQWAADGFLTLVEGSMIDPANVAADVIAWSASYTVREFPFDSWNAASAAAKLEQAKATVVAVAQGYQTYTEPCHHLEALLAGGKLRHGGHPVLRWMAGQMMVKHGPNDAIRPWKPHGSGLRNDGIVAMLMAINRLLLHMNKAKREPVFMDFDA